MTGIRRLDLGYFVRPASETDGAEPRVEPVLRYVVRRDEGVLLFDTGLGEGEPEVDAHYLPSRRDLTEALADARLSTQDGGNPRFAGVPILAQAPELDLARRADRSDISVPPWLDQIMDFDPRRVDFAHNNSVWEPA